MKIAAARNLRGLRLEDQGSQDRKETKGAERFTALYLEHQSLVRAVIYQIAGSPALRESINDFVQEAFIRIWKGLPEFREEAKITSWIYRVSTNVALDAHRSFARRAETLEADLTSVAEERDDSERELMNRQLVDQGLRSLSEDHRAVVVLALIHERPLSEIAEILEISEGTVKSRLHYGKEHFRKFLEERGAKP